MAFGREVARGNPVGTKGRAKGLERGKYALGVRARRSDEYVPMSSVARTWPYRITAQPPTKRNSALASQSSINKSAKS